MHRGEHEGIPFSSHHPLTAQMATKMRVYRLKAWRGAGHQSYNFSISTQRVAALRSSFSGDNDVGGGRQASKALVTKTAVFNTHLNDDE